MYLDNSLVQESAVELIRVVGLVMSILMLSLSNFLRAVWQADSINGRNSIFKFKVITTFLGDYSKSRRQRMKQNKKQLPLDQVTAKKLKRLTWIYRHTENLQEKMLILRLFEFYYQIESD